MPNPQNLDVHAPPVAHGSTMYYGQRKAAVLRQKKRRKLADEGEKAHFLYFLLPLPAIVLVFLLGEREMPPIPLLTPYKMGRFDLSHRSVTIYSKLLIFFTPLNLERSFVKQVRNYANSTAPAVPSFDVWCCWAFRSMLGRKPFCSLF